MSALLKQNHFAVEGLLRAYLAGLFPGQPALPPPMVGGLTDYLTLLDGGGVELPAVFVLFEGEDVAEASGPYQLLARQVWQVALACARGERYDLEAAGPYVARLIAGLNGARLDASLRPLTRVADRTQAEAVDGMVLVYLSFAVGVQLR